MRLLHAAMDLRVFAAVAGANQEAAIVLEIPVSLRPQPLRGVSGRRLKILASDLPGLPAGRAAIIVQLLDPDFEDLFTKLGADFVDAVSASSNATAGVHAVIRLIERWRRFLDRHSAPLSSEEVRGLIGELAVLERLSHRLTPAVALAAWKAPRGSIRDFECADRTIEVKTFMASSGSAVRISNPMQLEPEPGVPLLLACQELSRSQLPQFTLPGHIARIAQLFLQEGGSADDYEDALAASGYLPVHSDLYPDSYALGPILVHGVVPSFPRIHPANLPAGVVSVQFSLEILILSRFRVDADVEIGAIRP